MSDAPKLPHHRHAQVTATIVAASFVAGIFCALSIFAVGAWEVVSWFTE